MITQATYSKQRPYLTRGLGWRSAVLRCAPLLLLSAQAWAHGGTPRVLSITRSEGGLSVLDTLGLFEAPLSAELTEPLSPIPRGAWRWLCDDAVDAMAGVDAAVRVDEQTLVAVARSGAYRSDDNGCSFSAIGAPLSEHSVALLSAHPERRGELVAASHTLGRANDIFLSRDGGLSWRAAGLSVDGGIYALWRASHEPDQLWVSHAQGLSLSRDGGESFELQSLEVTPGLGLSEGELNELLSRPQALKIMGGGVAQSGPYQGQALRWMSVNLYPNSTLLQSVDGGAWEPIHQVADSYDSLAFTGETLIVSTTFEGTFSLSFRAEGEAWRQRPELMIGCLHAAQGELWACGRGADRPWLVGRSLDEGQRWSAAWADYQDASGASWGCAEDEPSALACEARCLDEGCDPSGLEMGGSESGPQAGSLGSSGGAEAPRGGAEASGLERAPSTGSGGGCSQSGRASLAAGLWRLSLLALLALLALLTRSRRLSCAPPPSKL